MQQQLSATTQPNDETTTLGEPPTTAEPPVVLTGVLDELKYGPFPNSEFSVENAYQNSVGAQWFLAFAGVSHLGTADAHAAIRVYSGPWSDDAQEPAYGAPTDVAAPQGFTDLKVLSAAGSVLTLDDPTTGQQTTFDLSTLTFQ